MFNGNLFNYVSKCVNRDKTISSSDTIFDFLVNVDIFGFFSLLAMLFPKTFTSKTASLRYVFDNEPSAKLTARTLRTYHIVVNICNSK